MLRIRKSRWGLWVFDGWVVVFTLLVFWGLHKANDAARDSRQAATRAKHTAQVTRNLALENQNRIRDIQRARVASCKRTYDGIREVFKPFSNPKDPRVVTFNKRIDELKKACPKQTRVKKERG